MQADVVIIGAGAMGSMALWRLAERGVHAVAIEQFEPGNDHGSSHGESRSIRTAYFESPDYVPLVREAFGLWRELEGVSGTSLLTMTGILCIGSATSEVIEGTLASARAHDLAHDVMDATAMRKLYPQHHMAPGNIAVYEKDAGFLRPEESIKAAIARAQQLGAVVLPHTTVQQVEAGGRHVRVSARGLTIEARHTIVAVGPWLGDFLPELQLPLVVSRQVTAWFPVRRPEPFVPDHFPIFAHEIRPGRMHYGFPTLDGQTIKISNHHRGVPVSPDDIDRTVHAEDLTEVLEFVRETLPGIDPEPVRSQVCMYTNTPDGHFIVGTSPHLPGVSIFGGFSGHGFKFAPVMGDVAADLALTGQTAYPIGLFSPDRFSQSSATTV